MTAVAPSGCLGFREGEEAVVEPDEKWLRVCLDRAENWDTDSDQPSDMMFQWATTGDRPGELSGSRESKAAAGDVLVHQRDVEGKSTRGVWSLRVADLDSLDLHLHDDSALLPPPPEAPPGHTFLDLRHVAPGKGNPAKFARQALRTALLDLAVEEVRG